MSTPRCRSGCRAALRRRIVLRHRQAGPMAMSIASPIRAWPSCTRRRCATVRPTAPRRIAATRSCQPYRCSAPRLIELPLQHQRRVAVMAAVAGRNSSGTPWRVDLIDVHLDTTLALWHGGPWTARRRQATALVEALRALPPSSPEPSATVLAGDLNSWLGADDRSRPRAARELQRRGRRRSSADVDRTARPARDAGPHLHSRRRDTSPDRRGCRAASDPITTRCSSCSTSDCTRIVGCWLDP